MSSPTKINGSPMGAREGQRIILREITASLHNSPPSMAFNNKNVNDTLPKVLLEQEIRVEYSREFDDTANYPPPPSIVAECIDNYNSTSSANNYQNFASTLNTTSTSAIYGNSPTISSNVSYTNLDVSGLDDLISACAAINLGNTTEASSEQSFADATFTSATDEFNQTRDLSRSRSISPIIDANETQIINPNHNTSEIVCEHNNSELILTQNIRSNNIDNNCYQDIYQNSPIKKSISQDYATANDTFLQSISTREDTEKDDEQLNHTTPFKYEVISQRTDSSLIADEIQRSQIEQSTDIDADKSSHSQSSSLPILSDSLLEAEVALNLPLQPESKNSYSESSQFLLESLRITPAAPIECSENNCDTSIKQLEHDVNELPTFVDPISTETELNVIVEKEVTITNRENLDATVDINDINTNLFDETEAELYRELAPRSQNINIESNSSTQVEYNNFLQHQQSTSLNNFLTTRDSSLELSPVKSNEIGNFEYFNDQNKLTKEHDNDFKAIDEQNIVNDICDTSLKLVDENKCINADSTDLWRDPTHFDFLLSKKADSTTVNRLRAESLYVKFDPLVSDISMLPQGNGATAPPNDETNGEKEASMPLNIGTPKRNPAIAAIDRLLFYSPMSPGNQKSEEPKKIEPTEKTTPDSTPVIDSIMAKELELVRATVLQLEEQLEKQKLEHDQLKKERKVDREAFEEAITQLQKQLNQEIKSKNDANVVVDEYEKSISRLIAERERDRKSLDIEKSGIFEELQEVKNHLAASEAAFNDVHAKYERLKVVVTASKNNEAALKSSIAENVEIIKTLEDRYDQIKTHAAVRLEKANLELEAIRKQHESETLKLRAMLRKEELKSSSLAETIEQKTKENKELTKILDEVIARVDTVDDK